VCIHAGARQEMCRRERRWDTLSDVFTDSGSVCSHRQTPGKETKGGTKLEPSAAQSAPLSRPWGLSKKRRQQRRRTRK